MTSEKSEFKSSWVMQLLIKSMPLIFGLILFGMGLFFLIAKVEVDSTGELIPPNMKYGFMAGGIPLIALFYLIKDRFGVVDLDNHGIVLERKSDKREKEWKDVLSVFKLPFCSPPIYRMSFKDGEKPIYFIFGSFFILTTPIYSYDFTGFLKFAEKRLMRENDGEA